MVSSRFICHQSRQNGWGRKKLEEINEIGLRLVSSQCREALSLPFEEQVRLDDQALTG